MWKGFMLGFLVASCLCGMLGVLYANWQRKIGILQGHKEGNIEIIDFLAKHFPEPNGEIVLPGHFFGLKWYGVSVIETNGIKTIRVKNKM